MRRYAVRVVQTHLNEGGAIDGAFIESLRYAGLVTIHSTDPHGLTFRCFDIEFPGEYLDGKVWSEQNAERMRSFGFNAVSAPSTRSYPIEWDKGMIG